MRVQAGVSSMAIALGQPVDNTFIESFNGKFRYGYLDIPASRSLTKHGH